MPFTKYFYSITNGLFEDGYTINHLNLNPATLITDDDLFFGKTKEIECACGNIIEVTANNLGRHVNSCGCLNKENVKKTLIKENEYDLSGLYGIGYTSNTNKEFKFDLEDYELVRQYYWRENQNGYCTN